MCVWCKGFKIVENIFFREGQSCYFLQLCFVGGKGSFFNNLDPPSTQCGTLWRTHNRPSGRGALLRVTEELFWRSLSQCEQLSELTSWQSTLLIVSTEEKSISRKTKVGSYFHPHVQRFSSTCLPCFDMYYVFLCASCEGLLGIC